MTYDELLQDFADRDVTAAKEIRRRNSPYWKLRRQWRWLAVATLVITFVPIGVALDDRTNLDVGTLLLYFTVVGALSAAYFAMQQAREARRHTESVLRPYLVLEGDDEARPPEINDTGLYVTVRNHGGGLARVIEYHAALLPANLANHFPSEAEFESLLAKGLESQGRPQPLGSGFSVRLRVMAWNQVPRELLQSRAWTLMVHFSYVAPYGRREGNARTIPIELDIRSPLPEVI